MMATQQTIEDESTAFDTQIHGHMSNGNSDSTTNSSESKKLPSRKSSLMDYATPTAHVSAFCRSVLSTLIPNGFWGEDDTQTSNKDLFMKVVDRFITLRRFETVSLHDAVQGMKVCECCACSRLASFDICKD
jgi:telomerase reverse transcriptase